MGRDLILDTNVLIDGEKSGIDWSVQFGDDTLAIASVTLAEYLVGVERADTPARKNARSGWLRAVLSVVEVLDYTSITARHHARLIAATQAAGKSRGAHDLIIAAHAVEEARIIVSRDAKARFGDLPGVPMTLEFPP